MSPWIIGGKEKLVQSSPVFRICSEIDLLFLSVTSFNLLAVRWSQWRHTANILCPKTYQLYSSVTAPVNLIRDLL